MDIEKVGKAISYLRKRAGYTQKELSDRLGVSDKAVSKWERGLGLPDISLLGKLSVLLDTDTDSLLAGDVIHHDKGWHGLLILKEDRCGIGPAAMVYDKPLIYYLVGYYMLVGIKNIKIVCAPEHRAFIDRALTGDDGLDISISYGESVWDVVADEEFMYCDNLMICHGKSIIYGVDQTRFFQRAMVNKDRLTILAMPKGTKDTSSCLKFDENKKLVSSENEGQLVTQYNYSALPVAFCPKTLFCRACRPGNDPYDMSFLFAEKNIYVEVLDRGFVDIELESWDDVAEAADFVRIVQRRCGMVIYCIEEVAWRRGMISNDALLRRTEKNAGTAYGRYLRALFPEDAFPRP